MITYHCVFIVASLRTDLSLLQSTDVEWLRLPEILVGVSEPIDRKHPQTNSSTGRGPVHVLERNRVVQRELQEDDRENLPADS